MPDPVLGHPSCMFHSTSDRFLGGPHDRPAAIAGMAGGAMDGFIEALPETDRWCVGPLVVGLLADSSAPSSSRT